MQRWLILVRKTIQAEWPDFEALHYFQAFDCKSGLTIEACKPMLERLAATFCRVSKVPSAADVTKQFALCRPFAQRLRHLKALAAIDVAFSPEVAPWRTLPKRTS